ncbi:hypothetical protein [Arenimonas metalli]|uniref:Uncharacterized protein n=1 Tax=Arenimonas metalli CF5-1 TaxID=1384056 RepID=A0A091B600_9GAMM|nr:hypothetical protein [Arenimonas metalli]KFN47146.1 hypothetical protein N787_02250 [Arenimonas metalli CF5-1]
MSMWLMGFLYFAVDLAAVLLLAACWQRTRITGFAIVAASFVAGILARWTVPWVYRAVDLADGDMAWAANMIVQSVYLVIAVIAVAGFWDIYRVLKSRPAA